MSGTGTKTVLQRLSASFKAVPKARLLKQSALLHAIEDRYDVAFEQGYFQINSSSKVAVQLFIFFMLSTESIFAALAVFFTFITTGAIGFVPSDSVTVDVFFWLTMTILIFAVIFVFTSIAVLLHLHLGAAIIGVLLHSSLLSAITMSMIISASSAQFLQNGGIGFSDTFPLLLSLFATVQTFLYFKHHKSVCFIRYKAKMQSSALDNLIPDSRKGKILALSAKDHYVEIITENGKHLVRINLKDAIKHVAEKSGLLVHRSHWISSHAVSAGQYNKDTKQVILDEGTTIPVSAKNHMTVADMWAP